MCTIISIERGSERTICVTLNVLNSFGVRRYGPRMKTIGDIRERVESTK